MGDINAMGMALEDTYGEDNVLHKWLPVSDFKTSMKKNHVRGETIGSMGQRFSSLHVFEVEGSFNMLLMPELFPYLLYSLLGGLATSGPTDSQYLHICTPDKAPKSLTLGVLRDSGGVNIQETFPGAVIKEMKFSLKAPEPVMAAVSFFAKTMNLDSRGSPSFEATDPVMRMCTADDYYNYGGSADSYIKAAEITIKRNYPGLADESVIGLGTRKSATAGLITMEGTLDRIFKEDSALNEFLGSSSAVAPSEDINVHTLDVRSKSNTLIGSTSVFQVNWVADRIIMDTRDSAVDKQNLEVENIKWYAEDDGTTDFISVNVKSGRATVTN